MIEAIELKIEWFDEHMPIHTFAIDNKPPASVVCGEISVQKKYIAVTVDVDYVPIGGGEYRKIALHPKTRELVDLYVAHETKGYKDILTQQTKGHDIEIDKMVTIIRLLKRPWYVKLWSWLKR